MAVYMINLAGVGVAGSIGEANLGSIFVNIGPKAESVEKASLQIKTGQYPIAISREYINSPH